MPILVMLVLQLKGETHVYAYVWIHACMCARDLPALRLPLRVQQFILSGGIGGTISKSTLTIFFAQRSTSFVAKIYPGHTIPT